MTKDEAIMLKRRLVSVFKRKGRDGRHTRLFESLDWWQRDLLSASASLEETELPVIGGVKSQENWFLITTQKVVWKQKGSMQSVPIEQISQGSMDFNSLLLSGRTKLESQELRIETLDGRHYSLEIEEGSPLIGVWNVLKSVGLRNRKNAN
jgi:hypothetical protein